MFLFSKHKVSIKVSEFGVPPSVKGQVAPFQTYQDFDITGGGPFQEHLQKIWCNSDYPMLRNQQKSSRGAAFPGHCCGAKMCAESRWRDHVTWLSALWLHQGSWRHVTMTQHTFWGRQFLQHRGGKVILNSPVLHSGWSELAQTFAGHWWHLYPSTSVFFEKGLLAL